MAFGLIFIFIFLGAMALLATVVVTIVHIILQVINAIRLGMKSNEVS
jgi:hypothetical protein